MGIHRIAVTGDWTSEMRQPVEPRQEFHVQEPTRRTNELRQEFHVYRKRRVERMNSVRSSMFIGTDASSE